MTTRKAANPAASQTHAEATGEAITNLDQAITIISDIREANRLLAEELKETKEKWQRTQTMLQVFLDRQAQKRLRRQQRKAADKALLAKGRQTPKTTVIDDDDDL